MSKTKGKKKNQQIMKNTVTTDDTGMIFVLGITNNTAPGLSPALESQGFKILSFMHPDDLEGEIVKRLPQAVIIEGSFIHDFALVKRELKMQQELQGQTVPVLCISRSQDLEQRLIAMRVGVDVYYTTPVDNDEIIRKTLDLLQPKDTQYRVLIVEDDPAQAKFAASVLEKGDMKTRTVTEPLKILAALDSFHPDLVLMDLYMPDANGAELTRVIRDHPEFVSIPIVFLSGEQNTDKKLNALSFGADDFLSKPIRPRHLINTIKNRVERARTLQYRDGDESDRAQDTGHEKKQSEAGDRIKNHGEKSKEKSSTPTAEKFGAIVQKALANNEFQMVFQPLINKESENENNFDLSLRLQSPEMPVITYKTLKETAVTAGLLVDVDRWIVEYALKSIEVKTDGKSKNRYFLQQSVNSILDQEILTLLKRQPRLQQKLGTSLVLEYTISELGSDLKKIKHFFGELQTMGIGIALSKFRTNDTAFKALKYFHPDYLRITRKLLAADLATVEKLISYLHKNDVRVMLPREPRAQDIPSHWLKMADFTPDAFV